MKKERVKPNYKLFNIVETVFDRKFGPNRDLKIKAFNSEMSALLFFILFNLGFNIIFSFNIYFVLINILFFLFGITMTRLANIKRNYKKYIYMMCRFTNFIFVPLLFLFGGGLQNGVLYYFLMSLILSVIILDENNKEKTIYIGLEILLYYSILLRSYLTENIDANNMIFYLNNLVSIIAFSISLGSSFLYIMNINEKQLEKLERMNKYLKKTMVIDPLTGAWNRKYMIEKLEEEMAKDRHLSVVMFDIDYFKDVNDTYGHQEGDNILKSFTNIINDSIRKEDVLTRYGGEEFLLILPNTTEATAYRLAEKVRKNVMKYLMVEEDNKIITVSGGVAEFNNDETVLAFIERADQNLYYAKEHGRNQISVKNK